MVYLVVNTNQNVTITKDGCANEHINTLYAGLVKKGTSDIVLNISGLSEITTTYLDGNDWSDWLAVNLLKVDNTAYEVLITCIPNEDTEPRYGKILLIYEGISSQYVISITLLGIDNNEYYFVSSSAFVTISNNMTGPVVDIGTNNYWEPIVKTVYENGANVYKCYIRSKFTANKNGVGNPNTDIYNTNYVVISTYLRVQTNTNVSTNISILGTPIGISDSSKINKEQSTTGGGYIISTNEPLKTNYTYSWRIWDTVSNSWKS